MSSETFVDDLAGLEPLLQALRGRGLPFKFSQVGAAAGRAAAGGLAVWALLVLGE